MPFILTACGGTSLARASPSPMYDSVTARFVYRSSPGISLLPGWCSFRDPPMSALDFRGINRGGRSRHSRGGGAKTSVSHTEQNPSGHESTFDDFEALRRCKPPLLIICHFSRIRSLFSCCCKNIAHRRENNESFVAHDSILLKISKIVCPIAGLVGSIGATLVVRSLFL